jgi:hypothetical protein
VTVSGGDLPAAPLPVTPWPVAIDAAGDIADPDDTRIAGAAEIVDEPIRAHGGGLGGPLAGGIGAAPLPASRAASRAMVDQVVYERVLFERDGLLAARALANLRAGIAEAVVVALVDPKVHVALSRWRDRVVRRAVTAMAHSDSAAEEPIDTDDIHDLMNDARGG